MLQVTIFLDAYNGIKVWGWGGLKVQCFRWLPIGNIKVGRVDVSPVTPPVI
jgi:hypothetical protein